MATLTVAQEETVVDSIANKANGYSVRNQNGSSQLAGLSKMDKLRLQTRLPDITFSSSDSFDSSRSLQQEEDRPPPIESSQFDISHKIMQFRDSIA